LESKERLIAGALPIRRIELSRYPRAYGDWFPNCRMAGRYSWGLGSVFGGGLRHGLSPFIGGMTVRAICTGGNESPRHTSGRAGERVSQSVRNVADKDHRAMRNPMPGLLGTALRLSLADAPSRSREDDLFCKLGRVVAAVL
jgi:hypothetical protein